MSHSKAKKQTERYNNPTGEPNTHYTQEVLQIEKERKADRHVRPAHQYKRKQKDNPETRHTGHLQRAGENGMETMEGWVRGSNE